MKYIVQYFFIFLFAIICKTSFTQNEEIDSLKRLVRISNDDTSKILVLNKIARQYFLLSKHDSSFYYCNQIRVLSEKQLIKFPNSGNLTSAYQRGISMSYNVYGLNYSSMGDYSKALYYLNLSLELSQKINDKKGIAAAYGNIGNVYYEQGRYPEALNVFLITLKIREEIKDKRGMANSFLSLGNVYGFTRNYDLSLKYYYKALVLFEELKDRYSMAGTYSNIAGIYTGKKYYEQALKMYYSYLEIMIEFEDQQSIASTHGNIGNILVYQEKYENALQEYLQALTIYETIDDKSGIALSNINVGEAYFHLKNYKKAEFYLLKGLDLAKDVNELESLRIVYGSLYELYEKIGKFKLALDNYKLAVIYRDSITNKENTEQTTRLEMNFEFDKKQVAVKLEHAKRESIAKAESKKQQIIIWSISALLLLVCGFAIFVFRSYKQKKEANEAILKQKYIIEEKQKEILDSIYYARKIQRALLTSEKYIERNLNKFIK